MHSDSAFQKKRSHPFGVHILCIPYRKCTWDMHQNLERVTRRRRANLLLGLYFRMHLLKGILHKK